MSHFSIACPLEYLDNGQGAHANEEWMGIMAIGEIAESIEKVSDRYQYHGGKNPLVVLDVN